MFTKDQLKKFRIDFDKAVQQLAKDYDVEISLGSISYGDSEFHSKITVKSKTVNGVEYDRFEFEKGCFIAGLKKEDYGKSFKQGNKIFTIKGIDLKARKNCILLKGSDGKTYKASLAMISAYIQ
jgi:hypothetical protein